MVLQFGSVGNGTIGRHMIIESHGNLLEADVEALVNTVNCVGFMGKGIALQFKQAFPENLDAYQRAVKKGDVQPGKMFVFETRTFVNPKFIINFPTKRHWRGKSQMADIEEGLSALVEVTEQLGIRSMAIPPLGCGNGGLDWSEVRPLIARALERLPEVRVLLYAPVGAPEAKSMPIGTARPRMTTARALLIKLMERYLEQAYRLTLLEIQKLAYFLQEAGEPLRLRYEGGHYGPYAPNLNKVLERTEGHFTRGYGDSQRPDVEIELLEGAVAEADALLEDHPASSGRLEVVAALIEGFETPYGMELLSSVHWLATRGDRSAHDKASAVKSLQSWSERKRTMFKPAHIEIAWDHITKSGWLKNVVQ